MSKIIGYLRYALIPVSLGLFAIGYLLGGFNIMLIGVLALWLCNVCFAAYDYKNQLFFLVLHAMLLVFLISRPMISMFRGDLWWYFDDETVQFALNALVLSMLMLRVGAEFTARRLEARQPFPTVTSAIATDKTGFMYSLQTVSLLFFAVTMAFYLLSGAEKLLFMQGRDYAEFYISFESSLPSVFHLLASMMKYSLCVFLATMPEKKKAFIPLAVFVMSALPSLIIGIRNEIVLNCVFVIEYYLLRDILSDREKWLGNTERLAIILVIPFALVFLSAYNYLRQGETVDMSVGESIVDLFYKQGVSFDVLCMGYDAMPDLPDVVPKNYTFGELIDYITRGSIGQRIFDSVSLGSSNSVEMAVYGNSFAHSMSYVAHPEYLQGHGWGSSYLLETFADWGYGGIAVYSLLLGGFCVRMVRWLKTNVLVRTIILVAATSFAFIPRAEATGWLTFVVYLQFWIAVLFCVFMAQILTIRSSDGSLKNSCGKRRNSYA